MSTSVQPLVLMTAGGTGGHVYPALAVATELMARGLRVEWVGTARGLEHRVVPAQGITLHCLPVRRNVVVADTDAEAEQIAIPAFNAMNDFRAAMRDRVIRDQGLAIAPPDAGKNGPPARTSVEHGLVHGGPDTVARKLAPIASTGVGGMIIQFRLGPMTLAQTERSLTLFRDRVMPALH